MTQQIGPPGGCTNAQVQMRVAPDANKGENQLLRRAETESNHIFFTAVHFKVIMLEISPTEPGRDDICESGMGNTVMNVLYSRLTPA